MTYAYIGRTTMGKGVAPATGVTVVDLDGANTRPVTTTATEAVNPMYLAASPARNVIYAAHATDDAHISAWIADGASLRRLGPTQPSGGGIACHLSVHPAGQHVLTANYATGTIAVHPINQDGSLAEVSHIVHHYGSGPNADRQDRPHTHMIITDSVKGPNRGHVVVVDLGTDTIHRYNLCLDAGQLTKTDQIAVPPGKGPRHLVIHDRYAYIVGELTSALTVVDLAETPPRVLKTVPTHAAVGDDPSYPSAVRLSPDHRHLYVLNRGQNTIAVFTVDGPEVTLIATIDALGDFPCDGILHNSHLYVVNQRSNTLNVFLIDPSTGIPHPTRTRIDIPHPMCILTPPFRSILGPGGSHRSEA